MQEATRHNVLPAFSTMLGLFMLPLTAVTLLVLLGRGLRSQGHPWGPERRPESSGAD